MKDALILKKAIERAVKNGYFDWFGKMSKEEKIENATSIIDSEEFLVLIFSHDFAKAFWGIGKYEKLGYKRICYSPWKRNLQKMVLEKEPLKYLEKFL